MYVFLFSPPVAQFLSYLNFPVSYWLNLIHSLQEQNGSAGGL